MLHQSDESRELSTEEALKLSSQLHSEALPEKSNEIKLVRYTKALNVVEKLNERSPIIWESIGQTQYNIGVVNINLALGLALSPQQAITWLEKSMTSFSRIEIKDRTANLWIWIADTQYSLSRLHRNNLNYPRYCAYLQDSLISYYNAATMGEFSSRVHKIYVNLNLLSLNYSLEKQLYSFAVDIFSDKPLPNFEETLFTLHLDILRPGSLTDTLLPRLAMLMRFMVIVFGQSTLPNKDVKKWLSDAKNYERFMEIINDAETHCKLVDSITVATPSFSLAVAVKISELEKSIKNLQMADQEKDKTIQMMKKKIQHLKRKKDKSGLNKESVYDSQITVFRSPSSQKIADATVDKPAKTSPLP